MSKAFGRDINKYYNKYFPEDAHIDDDDDLYEQWMDEYADENGYLGLPEGEKFELAMFGIVYSNNTAEPIGSFQSLFKRWLKSQSTATIVLEVPKDKLEESFEQLKQLGFKVVK